jgi:hypothetical protein
MPKKVFEDSLVKKYLNKNSFNASDEKKLRKYLDKHHTFQGVDDLMQRFQNQRRKNYVKRQSDKTRKDRQHTLGEEMYDFISLAEGMGRPKKRKSRRSRRRKLKKSKCRSRTKHRKKRTKHRKSRKN